MKTLAFAHDGQSVLTSMDPTGTFNVYRVPVTTGAAQPLTRSSDTAIFVRAGFPGDPRFLYATDGDGDERSHLHVWQPDGSTRDLTPGRGHQAKFLDFDETGAWLFVQSNERDPTVFDLYRYATADYRRELVFRNQPATRIAAISPDARWLALTRSEGAGQSALLVADLRAGTPPRAVAAHLPPGKNRVQGFDSTSRRLRFSSDGAGEFQEAFSYDLDSRRHRPLLSADWDVVRVAQAPGGRHWLAVVDEDSRRTARVFDGASDAPIPLSLPVGDVVDSAFSRDGQKLALAISRDRAATDLYVVDMRTKTAQRRTDNSNPAIDSEQLVDGQVVRYQSFDGLSIPAILYRPRGASRERPAPTLVWVHGGPGGQSRLGYHPLVQYLVNQGYGFLAVNNRGSSGYGKTFSHLDDRRHGEADLDDCVWAHRYLASLPWVDGARIGIMGGSYGGYMTLAALTFRPQVFAVGVDLYGVSNWVRTLENLPPRFAAIARHLHTEVGHPVRDRERLHRISPLFHADRIVRPLMVVQGANDPRVLPAESEDIVAAVRKRGVPVEYLLLADEGHGFAKRDNFIRVSRAIVGFLDRHLRADPDDR